MKRPLTPCTPLPPFGDPLDCFLEVASQNNAPVPINNATTPVQWQWHGGQLGGDSRQEACETQPTTNEQTTIVACTSMAGPPFRS